ncbi:MAG: TFIIB-type zinc ribbon-containing protein [Candidatus Aenigmarchaeota archaeon]|nr:TFIIB-type zinc ribbon-containing protein [Candidatus Aenigmarchaeota archaeon]
MTNEKCPECGGEKLVMNSEGLICSKCGLIISETYFSGNEVVR